MTTYAITLKGVTIATVEAVTKEWAIETWRASLTPEEYARHRGAIPRGVGEYDADPWDGLDAADTDASSEHLRRYVESHGWTRRPEWDEPGSRCYVNGQTYGSGRPVTLAVTDSAEDKHGACYEASLRTLAGVEGRDIEVVRAEVARA